MFHKCIMLQENYVLGDVATKLLPQMAQLSGHFLRWMQIFYIPMDR
jgi:hypothetical protein